MSNIKIIPLGGVRENGKNLYVVESGEDIFVLDCGLIYPEDELFGIDAVIPDFSYLEENKDRIAGVFLTHGHEDAIGALPYFLDLFEVPVFGSELTIELAKLFVNNSNLKPSFDDFHVIDEKTEIDFNGTIVKFFRTTHTIPDSMGIAVQTEEGNIVYTGNFKFDQSAQDIYRSDLSQISDLGKEGVLALLSDSGEAESPFENVSEKKVQEEVLDTFQNTSSRIIVAAVASNILRVQQVLNAAYHSNRKVFITGKNLEAILETALRLNKLTLPDDNLIVPVDKIDKYNDDEILVLETGAAGEPIKTLNRMATGNHPQVNIKEGDLVFIATSPSTAMEVMVAKTENLIYRAEATVKHISDNIKASGHATPNDLQLMINLLKPTYFIPIQGEYRMLAAHASLAHETGIPYQNIFILSNGDVVSYEKNKMTQSGQVSADNTLIDGIGIGDIGNIVLRDRRLLSEDGIFVAVVTIDRKKQKIVSNPHIVTRGFVFVKESQDLINESSDIVKNIVNENLKHNDFDWGSIKRDIREALNSHLFKKTKRRPIILPVIMEVNQNRRLTR
ncbi:ribonuclease J [Alkalibacterium sp. 20]|uniref:ribonuclease J n=1 Tax=Alkalibacterium sp. 20 TaxID=1798803 RepID=UPI000900340C|nr:ribonuclease J [Alkalibacterium sp. 20]OJF89751.1 Zn-dependent hydrolase [Alkalibacterium sp. 20]